MIPSLIQTSKLITRLTWLEKVNDSQLDLQFKAADLNLTQTLKFMTPQLIQVSNPAIPIQAALDSSLSFSSAALWH